MRQRAHQRSCQLNNIALACQQRQLAAHLRDIKARRIQANEPRRSIRLHAQDAPGYRYIVFGGDGYADPSDICGELPRFVFRRMLEGQGHLQGRTGREGATTTSSQGDEGSQSNNLVDGALRSNNSTSCVANTGDKGEDLSTNWDSDVHHTPIREDDSYASPHLYFWTRIPCDLYDRRVKEGRW
jgi:hypothetical protein